MNESEGWVPPRNNKTEECWILKDKKTGLYLKDYSPFKTTNKISQAKDVSWIRFYPKFLTTLLSIYGDFEWEKRIRIKFNIDVRQMNNR